MSHICWRVEGAEEELKRLTKPAEKIILNVVEIPGYERRHYYEIHTQPDVATIDIGSAFKSCSLADVWSKYPDENKLRRRLSNILNTPHACYQRIGEKIIAGFGIGHFTEPEDAKHISPRDELQLVYYTLCCASTIGFEKIPYIGRTETNPAALREALEKIAETTMHGRAYVLR
ncbi:MAG: hypothetical protein QW165_00855 [Candidatus Woesearchaeota archaeon]